MPQAIPLPPFSNQAIAIIGTPNAPSNPPSATDITKAMHYSSTLLKANARKKVPDEDVVFSEQYKNKLLFTRDGDAVPSWFAGAVEHILAPIIRDMKDDIGDMKDNIGDMKDNIRVMKDDIRIMKVDILDVKRVQDQVWKLAAKNHNLSASAGDEAGFEVVLFASGQDPTKDPRADALFCQC